MHFLISNLMLKSIEAIMLTGKQAIKMWIAWGGEIPLHVEISAVLMALGIQYCD